MRYTTFIKKQDYYNIKVLITQSFSTVLRITYCVRKKKEKIEKRMEGKERLVSKDSEFLTGGYLTSSDTGTISMPALINSGIILFNT